MEPEIQSTTQDHRPISEEVPTKEVLSSPDTQSEINEEVIESDNVTLSLSEKPVEKATIRSEKKKRLSITVNFPVEEAEYIDTIIEARVKSGLTSDNGHFIRQCVDFAIHMEKLHGRHQAGFSFATPADLPVTYLKGGFFKQKK
jgi:hypothetical protein